MRTISEHAFGNALDIAAFVLADGHRITVKDGWQGSPEEQGFLRDVQAAACDQFTTVLAPGSNQFHYDHIHVDLMRRGERAAHLQSGRGGRRSGRGARARQNPRYASRSRSSRRRPGATIRRVRAGRRSVRLARRRARDPATHRLGRRAAAGIKNPAAEDNDWVEEPGPRPAIDWSSNSHKVR